MVQIRSLIIDDNPHSRDELKYLLEAHQCIEVVGEAESGVSGLEQTRTLKPDVVFLDIRMPHLSGMDYADIVRKEFPSPPRIVFVTAYKEHAQEGFNYQPIHFLTKPIDEKQLSTAITWIQESISPPLERIGIRGKEATTYLGYDSIIYISCKNAVTTVHTPDIKYETNTTLQEFITRLEQYRFCRVHRNYLVNYGYKGEIKLMPSGDDDGCGVLVIKDCQDMLPVSRKYYKKLEEKLAS